ncbi:hypothetical protein [Marinobacterium jannaschii]|uniref:hypothetical protein n=1 Tax=Marinobacterium jannaschii TaxID=64970 RepID=UPI0004852E08|nr:hypothetical protein [Marinobacterium jannaschii]
MCIETRPLNGASGSQLFNYLARIEEPGLESARELYSDSIGEMIHYLCRCRINPRRVTVFECGYPELRPADARLYNVANGIWQPR